MFALDSVSFLKTEVSVNKKDLFIASVRLAANDQIVEDGDLVEASEKSILKPKYLPLSMTSKSNWRMDFTCIMRDNFITTTISIAFAG